MKTRIFYVVMALVLTVALAVPLLSTGIAMAAVTAFSDDFESDFSQWDDNGTTPWAIKSDHVKSGSTSAEIDSSNSGFLTSDDIDLSDAIAADLDFWFHKKHVDWDEFELYFWDGGSYNLIDSLDTDWADDAWNHWNNVSIDLGTYGISNFRIQFYGYSSSGSDWATVDLLVLTKTVGERICDDNIDNDGDGPKDCADSDCMIDDDGDNYDAEPCGTDCDDGDPAVNPGATEACNGKDDNCDGAIDEEGATGCTTYYKDHDGDTYGVTGDSKCLCAPSGEYTATVGGDCNDDDPNVNTNVAQICTGWQSPTTNAADAGDGFESNAAGAYDDDGTGFALNVDGPSDSHRYGNYSFSIPAVATTIDGIEVRLDAWIEWVDYKYGSGWGSMNVELSWNNGGTWTAAQNSGDLTASEATYILGGPADEWGHTPWTPAELGTGNFRVRISFAPAGYYWYSEDFYLDWVPVRVCYTMPEGYISLTPDTDTNCVGKQHTVTATIVGDTGGTQVTFNVTAGPNILDTGTVQTDACGMASWTYTGDGGFGTDNIVAYTDGISNTVSKTWLADPGPPTTQLVMMLDASGSINTSQWNMMITGLANAINNSACVPADGSVELTIIQFQSYAKLEIRPVVINDTDGDPTTNRSHIANLIESIQKLGDKDSYTCIACAICLAQDVLLNHPKSNFDICRKQVLNLVTDGEPNRRTSCDQCTGAELWECPSTGHTNAKNSAVNARNYAIAQLGMTDDQDEFDVEFVNTPDGASDWLRTAIVWPEQADGDGYYAPLFDQGPGWVALVTDAGGLEDAICQKLFVEPIGACCDLPTGSCTDGVIHECCQHPLKWHEGKSCAEIDCEPNMTIDKDTSTPIIEPGGTVTYTINVTNWDTATAINVSIWDTLPGGFTFKSTDGIVETGLTTPRYNNVSPTPPDTDLLWGYWDIPSGGSVAITFTAAVPGDITPGTYENTAVADGDNFEWIDDEKTTAGDPGTPGGEIDTGIDEDVTVERDEEPPPMGVPTLSQWGMIAMGILFAAFLIWTVRRRLVISADRS